MVMNFDKTRDLDLFADHLIRKMEPLCGEAVREKIGRHDVMDILGVGRATEDPTGDPWNLEPLMYADGILCDVFRHIGLRWGQFRETERRLRSAAAPTYEDESEFD